MNTLEIADFVLNFSKFYDGYPYPRGNGGITVDISDNPFKDGWYCYLGHENDVEGCDCYQAIVNVMYGKILEISHYFRPFKLKYHGKKHFGLGQKIKLPDRKFSVFRKVFHEMKNDFKVKSEIY